MYLHSKFHVKRTKDTKFVLNDFDNQVKNFVKVFPKDYKKALKVNAEKSVAQKV